MRKDKRSYNSFSIRLFFSMELAVSSIIGYELFLYFDLLLGGSVFIFMMISPYLRYTAKISDCKINAKMNKYKKH